MGVSWEKKSAKRAGRATMIVESMNLSQGTTWYRRRFPRGGGGGAAIVTGQLIAEIDPDSYLEDCIKLEKFTTWYEFELDEDDEPIVIGGINGNLNTPMRGSVGVPVRVWGKIRTLTIVEGEEEVQKRFLEILAPNPEMTIAHGHVTSPANGRGQSLGHISGSDAYGVDGAPCGE